MVRNSPTRTRKKRIAVQKHVLSGEEILEWQCTVRRKKRRLLQGPAKEALSLLDDESVDCVVTSPPYFWLRDYKVSGQIGLEDSVDDYVEALTGIMSEVYRVLRSDGVLFLNLEDTYYS